MSACTYNVATVDQPDRECGRPAVARWVRLSDGSERVIVCQRHDATVGRALGQDLPWPDMRYRREALHTSP